MPRLSKEALASVADLFSLLSHPTRLRLVRMLAAGRRNVISLCQELNMAQPAVSHHLGLLRRNRLIVGQRAGQRIIYSLAPHVRIVDRKLRFSLPPYRVTVEG